MRLAKLTGVMTLTILLVSVQSARAELLALYEGDVINTPAESVALDSSGNGNHGAFQGSAGLTADGHTGGALNFNADRSHMVLNTSTGGAFDSIFDTQGFSIGFWMAGGDTNPRNTSVFWADGVTPNGGNRAIQSHATWSNSQIYLDIGGCCSGSQRLNGPLDEEFIGCNRRSADRIWGVAELG